MNDIDLNNLPGTRINGTVQINITTMRQSANLGSLIVRAREDLARSAGEKLMRNDGFFSMSEEIRVGGAACHIIVSDFIAISRMELLRALAKAHAAGADSLSRSPVISGF